MRTLLIIFLLVGLVGCKSKVIGHDQNLLGHGRKNGGGSDGGNGSVGLTEKKKDEKVKEEEKKELKILREKKLQTEKDEKKRLEEQNKKNIREQAEREVTEEFRLKEEKKAQERLEAEKISNEKLKENEKKRLEDKKIRVENEKQEELKKEKEKRKLEEEQKKQEIPNKIKAWKEFNFAGASLDNFQKKVAEIYDHLNQNDDDKELVKVFTEAVAARMDKIKGNIDTKYWGDGDVDLRDSYWEPQLKFAHGKAMKYVLKALVKSAPNLKNENRKTAFQLLVGLEGAEDIVKGILSDENQVKTLTLNKADNIPYPFASGDMLKLLEKKLGKVTRNTQNELAQLLNQALIYGANEKIINYLVEKGAMVDESIMESAARNSTVTIFNLLKSKLKDKLSENGWNNIFLSSLQNYANLDIASELLKEDGNYALAKDDDGNTALSVLFKTHVNDIYKKQQVGMGITLIKAGAPFYGKGLAFGSDKLPAVFFAISNEKIELLKTILEKAKETNLLDQILGEKLGKENLSALQFLCIDKTYLTPLQESIAIELVNYGATFFGKDLELGKDKVPAIAFAITFENLRLLKAILEKAKEYNLLKEVLQQKIDKQSLLEYVLDKDIKYGIKNYVFGKNTKYAIKNSACADLINAGARVSEGFLNNHVSLDGKKIYEEMVKEAEKKN